MLQSLLISLFIFTYPVGENKKVEFSIGASYSHFYLYQDIEDPRGKLGFTGEIGVTNFIPYIGLKIRGSRVRYEGASETNPYEYEYIPLTLCTSFNLLPFMESGWLSLSMETGFGLYLWRGFDNGEVVVLSNGSTMQEKDIGFVGGLSLQVRPYKLIALEIASRFNYVASSDLEKYGYSDKDEKLWENGVGLKIIMPW